MAANPNPLNQIINDLLQRWKKLEPNQKILLVIGAVLVAGLALGSLLYATRPDYALLYANLSSGDASAVVQHLREKKVPYRLSAGGTQIEVPSKQIYDLRLGLAGKGLPRGEGVGYEIFDKMSLGVTDEVQRINYLRALQNELERTIDSLDSIEKSRVHLVMPSDQLWYQENASPSASVMVKLRSSGTLTPEQVSSLRHLLASAVQGLRPERVTIVDTQGRILSAAGDLEGMGLSSRQVEYKQSLEDHLKTQAESLLGQILGPNKVAVRVQAEVNFDQVITEKEYYAPVVGGKGLVRSEKSNNMSPSAAPVAAGPAGTAANLQGYPPTAGAPVASGASKNERVTNYEMNRTVERITTATGSIRRLSVGVFVDGQVPAAQLTDLQTVLARALGIDPERGDQIEVKAFPFDRKAIEADRQLLEQSEKQQFWLTALTRWLPRGLLVLAALGLAFYAVRSLTQLAAKLGTTPAETPHNGNGKASAELISALIKQNPEETAQILKHWVS